MPDEQALCLGLMSGTSLDGIDCALVRIRSSDLELLDYRESPLAGQLVETLRFSTAQPGHVDLAAIGAAGTWLAETYADAVDRMLQANHLTAAAIEVIGMHGQTILHKPAGRWPFTMQIGNGALLAQRTGIPVVSDFRSADVAAGGQGAPLAPLFHAWQFAGLAPAAVVNIGGIANITLLEEARSDQAPTGFDTGPGNCLLDAWIQASHGHRFDARGDWAASGTVDETLLGSLLDDPYFAAPAPKSTGRDYFNLAWLRGSGRAALVDAPGKAADVQASLLALTVRTIISAVQRELPHARRLLVCGGGARNAALMQALRQALPAVAVSPTDSLGIPSAAVESVAFAWLAERRIRNTPLPLMRLTGARRPLVLGAVHAPPPAGAAPAPGSD